MDLKILVISFNINGTCFWEVYYPLDKDAEKAYGIILDNSNNLLISLLGKGVWKITPLPDTSKTLFIPVGNNAQKWDNFRFGHRGELYGVRSARGVWKLEENVAPAGFWAAPSAGIIGALEFDANQNLWTLNSSNCLVKQDKTDDYVPFTGVLRAIRIFNNECGCNKRMVLREFGKFLLMQMEI